MGAGMSVGTGKRVRHLIIAVVAATGFVAGCSSSGSKHKSEPNNAPKMSLAVTPTGGTKDLPVSTEIGVKYSGGWVSSVQLTKAGGSGTITGAMRPDLSTWVPDTPLDYGSTYNAKVTVTNDDGVHTTSQSTTFSTMGKPSLSSYGMYLRSGQTYGVGMPVVLEFDPPIAPQDRAAIQKRLFVSTEPSQPGVWHWTDDGQQVFYRPPEYWQAGTKIKFRAALAGVPLGNGTFGDQDQTADVSIGEKVTMSVDNNTKQMTVYQGDQVARTIPVSLGKPSTPSSSGQMVTMSHDASTIFDTTAEGPGGYRVQVQWAMRLTWGGEFIHAAPWSVGDQGHTNVSHGCVNMSDDNAQWLFGITHIGDPVSVSGTEVQLRNGNGWTAWNQSWGDYIKGSALPVPAELANWKPAPANSQDKAAPGASPGGPAAPAGRPGG